jgi:hypothetical protein
MVKRCAIPWCGRAGRRCARDRRARRRRARDRRARRRCARDRRAAPAHEITLSRALALATPSHKASQSTESHRISRWSSDMQYLAVAVLGAAVLGTGVLGAAVLHPHTRSLLKQHSLTLLLPTEHLRPRSRIDHRDSQAMCNTLVWPCWASQCSGPACWAPPCSGPACWESLCSGSECCTRTRDHSQHSTRSRHSFPQEHLNPRSRIDHRDGQAICNTLVWPCWAPLCSGPACSARPCAGPACCTRTRDHSQHSTRSRTLSHKSISIHRVASNLAMVKRCAIPWSGRAGRRCAWDRCARDRRAAPAHEITLNTALAHATPSHKSISIHGVA